MCIVDHQQELVTVSRVFDDRFAQRLEQLERRTRINRNFRKELDERGEWDICAGPGADHVYDRSARRGQHRSRIRGKPGLPYAGRSRDDDSGAWVALER